MKKTYRIEHQVAGNCWVLSHCWSGMLKGKTDGAMMVLNAMYGGNSYRAVCEQTGEVVDYAGGRSKPKPSQYEIMKNVSEQCRDLSVKLGIPIVTAVQRNPEKTVTWFTPLEND